MTDETPNETPRGTPRGTQNGVGRPRLEAGSQAERISVTVPASLARRMRAAYHTGLTGVPLSESIRRLIEADLLERAERDAPRRRHLPDRWWESLKLPDRETPTGGRVMVGWRPYLTPVLPDASDPALALFGDAALKRAPTYFRVAPFAIREGFLPTVVAQLRTLFAAQTDEDATAYEEPTPEELATYTLSYSGGGYCLLIDEMTIELPAPDAVQAAPLDEEA